MRRSVRKAVTKAVTKAVVAQVAAVGKASRWAFGPLLHCSYRLFIPSGVSASRPAPLLVLLHGCGQDAASFAVSTHAAAIARSVGCVVLLPEQSSQANPQRCWNWFQTEPQVAAEATLLMSLVEHICTTQPVRRERVYALGISAGGTMALTLALRFPERFAAVGCRSGAVPHSAINLLQATQAMHGRRVPKTPALRRRLAVRQLPPLIVLHGDADSVVSFANTRASAALWLALLPQGRLTQVRNTRIIQRGARKPYSVTDWTLGAKPYIRLIRIAGLGHAWSGSAPKQAYSDASGPDALKIAWRFFSG